MSEVDPKLAKEAEERTKRLAAEELQRQQRRFSESANIKLEKTFHTILDNAKELPTPFCRAEVKKILERLLATL